MTPERLAQFANQALAEEAGPYMAIGKHLQHHIAAWRKDEALLRQALEALEDAHYTTERLQDINLRRRIIDALRDRLK